MDRKQQQQRRQHNVQHHQAAIAAALVPLLLFAVDLSGPVWLHDRDLGMDSIMRLDGRLIGLRQHTKQRLRVHTPSVHVSVHLYNVCVQINCMFFLH